MKSKKNIIIKRTKAIYLYFLLKVASKEEAGKQASNTEYKNLNTFKTCIHMKLRSVHTHTKGLSKT